VSQAGKKLAEDDPRWLWPRFYKTIGLLQPKIVVVENVPGLRKRGFSSVLGDLAKGGYNAQWFSLRSSDIGAPHRRERIFIVANSNKEFLHWKLEEGTRRGSKLTVSTFANPGVTGTRRDARKIFGKKEFIGRGEENNSDSLDFGFEDASYTKKQEWGKYEGAIRRWESIFEPAPNPRTDEGRLSPNFVEWMMGFPQDWTEGVSRSQRVKMLGNSVQVQSAYYVAKMIESLYNG
jgi:DNA (cytosine-5)-methyltransferase 1